MEWGPSSPEKKKTASSTPLPRTPIDVVRERRTKKVQELVQGREEK